MRRVLLAVLVAVALSGGAPKQSNNHESGPQQHQGQATPTVLAKQPATIAANQPANGCPGTQYPGLKCEAISAEMAVQDHRQSVRQTQLFTAEIFITLLTLIVVAIAAGFARSASIAGHDANRPWIELAEGDIRPFHVSKDAAKFKADFHLFNRGKSPATNVVTLMVLMPFHPATDRLKRAEAAKRAVEQLLMDKSKRSRKVGITIFPKAKPTTQYVADEIDAGQIKKARGDPLGQVSFQIGVGVRYRFGRRFCYTVMSYDVVLSTGDIDFSEGHETAILPHYIQLFDCWVGYAK